MDREKDGDAPFRCRLNGNRCVLVVGDDSIRADFERFQKPFRLPYAAIRCVQFWDGTVLINVESGSGNGTGQLASYEITSSRAKTIHERIVAKIGGQFVVRPTAKQ